MSGHTPGLPPMKSPMPTPVDLFDVALDGASKALPVLLGILTTKGLKDGAMVADEINANVQCALKVYRERRPLMAAAPQLFDLAKQYASECGECAGVGVTIEDEDCSECKFIRDVIAKAGAA